MTRELASTITYRGCLLVLLSEHREIVAELEAEIERLRGLLAQMGQSRCTMEVDTLG